jgi:hypothetical protein
VRSIRTWSAVAVAALAVAVLAPASARTPDERARAAAPAVHTIGGCQVFPADNPWNTRIDHLPVARTSARIIARQAAHAKVHLDLGSTEQYYGIPVNLAARTQPRLPLRFGVEGENYADESDRGRVAIRPKAHIEGGSRARPNPSGGDRHLISVQRGSCELVELYKAVRVRNTAGKVVAWRASSAARWRLDSNALRPKGWTSADAAGLPILPGLLDYDEAASGQITHALRFTLPAARNAYTRPARHCGPNAGAAYPAYGMRFRLKASVPVRRYHGVARTIVVAMKRYGLMYADQGSPMYVTGTSDPRWANAIEQFRDKPLDGSRFEVVKPGRITVCR